MKILFLSRLFWPHGGGVEEHVFKISRVLIKKGYEISVITEALQNSNDKNYQSKPLGAKTTEIVNGIEVHRMPAGGNDWFKKFRIWIWLFKNKKIIQSTDIVCAHDVFFWYLPFRFLFPKKPVFTTFHGYETKFPVSKKAIFVRKLSEVLSDGNICVGDYIAKWYGTKPDYVIYGGEDTIQNLKFKIQNNKEKLKIILIGRFEEDIGVRIYLCALELLKKKEVEYQFEAYGEGSLKKEIEKYGKTYLFPKDVNSVIQNADIIFSSSYLTMLKIMINKKIIFSVYDNQLKKDYLIMTPFADWIFITESAEQLAKQIIQYFNNPRKYEYKINKAYEWSAGQTWEKVVEIYLKLWKQNITLPTV